ncbi:MAG: MBL fold metallo-hydrolase [Armatimonadetes bacterium]|nr:MBL fold metallo-hydrolase [Armatimonadota bacterium]
MAVTIEGVEITWLKHDSFLLRGEGVTIAIDPYELRFVPEKADLVLITHDHFDHCDPNSVKIVAKPDGVILAPQNAAKKLSGDVKIVKAGDVATEKGVKIKVVPAYNVRPERQRFHPKNYGGVGYLVTLAGKVIYHAGDTDLIPEMDNLGQVDIALLPVSGTYVMDADEAAEAIKRIKPTHAIPMHYGSIVGSQSDAEKLAKLVSGLTTVHILKPIG